MTLLRQPAQLVKDALELGRRNVLAAADDHFFLPISQVQNAFCIEIAHGPGAVPISEEAAGVFQ
jgi:hypothetical protein